MSSQPRLSSRNSRPKPITQKPIAICTGALYSRFLMSVLLLREELFFQRRPQHDADAPSDQQRRPGIDEGQAPDMLERDIPPGGEEHFAQAVEEQPRRGRRDHLADAED